MISKEWITLTLIQDSFFLLPYIKSISKKFKPITRNTDLSLAYTGLDNLKGFIKGHKDHLSHSYSNNVVYKIYCVDCKILYMDQIKRFLKTRIAEHHRTTALDPVYSSVITNHRIDKNHDFDWDNIQILDNKSFVTIVDLHWRCYI